MAVEKAGFHVHGDALEPFDTQGADRGAPAHRNCGSPLFSILGDADDVV